MALTAIAMALIGAAKGAATASNPTVQPQGGPAATGTTAGAGKGIGDMLGGVLGQIGQEKSTVQPTMIPGQKASEDLGMGSTFESAMAGQMKPVGLMDRIQALIDARKKTLGGFLGG